MTGQEVGLGCVSAGSWSFKLAQILAGSWSWPKFLSEKSYTPKNIEKFKIFALQLWTAGSDS